MYTAKYNGVCQDRLSAAYCQDEPLMMRRVLMDEEYLNRLFCLFSRTHQHTTQFNLFSNTAVSPHQLLVPPHSALHLLPCYCKHYFQSTYHTYSHLDKFHRLQKWSNQHSPPREWFLPSLLARHLLHQQTIANQRAMTARRSCFQ